MTKLLEELEEIVADCTMCNLHCTRTKAAFARGDSKSPLMIIGEAPSKEDDAKGVPFVGKPGQFLTKLLAAAKVPEDQVYLTNLLKCMPPKGRFPDGDQPGKCSGFLYKQIKEVNPKAIIVMGERALQYVLLHETHENPQPLMPWINKQYRRRDRYGDSRILCVYHPAYLMRRDDEIDMEDWINAVASLWSYVEHKVAGTPPAPIPFRDIRPAPIVPRQGRSLFAEERKKVL